MQVGSDSKPEVCHQDDVTDKVQGADTENDIVDGTDTGKTTEIEHCLADAQTMLDLIYTSQAEYNIAQTEARKKPNTLGTAKGLSVGWK